MKHYICTGGCGGSSQEEGVCQAETCLKHGLSLEECECEDGQHRKDQGKSQD